MTFTASTDNVCNQTTPVANQAADVAQQSEQPYISQSTKIPLRIAIIGGGLTGLITADLLEEAFKTSDSAIRITIFEKSAGVGRMATRYSIPHQADVIKTAKKSLPSAAQQWQFDFGAQFFTAQSAAFRTYLQPWIDKGTVVPWLAHSAQARQLSTESTENQSYIIESTGQWDDNQPRYVSSPKMTSLGREIASQLRHSELKLKTKVAPLTDMLVDKQMTQLKANNGDSLGYFDWVICTAPQAQAIELLTASSFTEIEKIRQPQMLACYSLMLGWTSEDKLPDILKHAQWDVLDIKVSSDDDTNADSTESSHVENSHGINRLGRVFVEHHKPDRRHILPSITIHADNHWSQQHVDEDIEAVKKQLLQTSQALLEWSDSTAPEHIDCHRWRYAATVAQQSNKHNIYIDTGKQWIVTGDWCAEGRIESCYHAARSVVASIQF